MPVRDRRFRFSVAVLLPVICAVFAAVGLAAGFILWSAERTDAQALAREQTLVAHLVDGAQADFEGQQGVVVLRYETTEAFLGDEPDMDWIDGEFGGGEYFDFGHERVYVLDPDLNPIYAAREGKSADVATYDDVRTTVDPIAVRFRASDLAAEIATFEAGDSEWPPQISDLIRLGGRVAFVSVMPIVSNWEGQEQEPGQYYYHVAIKLLDSDVARDMRDDYLLEGAHFDAVPNTLPHETMVPMANSAGRFVAYFKWQPQRPGVALLNETLPASLALLGVLGIVIALLLIGLGRSTRALDQARAEALHRATHDPLTGLANRALFKERLDHSPLPLGLLALDLDRFKQVNDELGHEAGDELLKQVAVRLGKLVRPDRSRRPSRWRRVHGADPEPARRRRPARACGADRRRHRRAVSSRPRYRPYRRQRRDCHGADGRAQRACVAGRFCALRRQGMRPEHLAGVRGA